MPGPIRTTAAMLLLTLAMLLTIACSSEPGQQPQSTQPPITEPMAQQQSQPNAPLPTRTRPPRLDLQSILTPTTEVRIASQIPTPTPKPLEEAKADSATQADQPRHQPNTAGVQDLIPLDPRTNDQVLLQDIYAKIDLSQFALDQDAPIPEHRGIGSSYHQQHGSGRYPYSDTLHHPYLHIFPQLTHDLTNSDAKGNDRVHYTAVPVNNAISHPSRDPVTTRTGVSRFLLSPWYELIPQNTLEVLDHDYNSPKEPDMSLKSFYYRHLAVGPYWFGHNSTRGVLAEAVAQVLRKAQLPQTKDMAFKPLMHTEWGKNLQSPPRPWKLEEYIRTPIIGGVWHETLSRTHRPPFTKWEFASDDLPVIRVTTWSSTILPLTTESDPPEVDDDHENIMRTETTDFAVSFVIALQNRWGSFQDPNRWLIRYQEDLRERRAPRTPNKMPPFQPNQGALTEENNADFPNYWHATDYMQHSIIGPVVVQVYQSPVLEPGIYSITPRITHWEAPGPILREEQVKIKGLIKRYLPEGPLEHDPNYLAPGYSYKYTPVEHARLDFKEGKAAEDNMYWVDGQLPIRAVPVSPNPGYPLPGHVLTDDATGPGTEIWERWGMDAMGHEW